MGTPLSHLTELSLALHRPMELDAMLQLIADRTAELVQSPLVSVRLLDASRKRLVATCRTGASLHRDRSFRYELGEGLVGWVADECVPLRLGDAEQDPRFLPRPDQEQTIGSFLGVPIVSQGECTGVLSAVHPARDFFTGEHEEELTLLAALIAPRVERGRRERIAHMDELTGALNRKGLDAHFPPVLDDEHTPDPLSVLTTDVDALERIDEEHGRDVTHTVLKRVAELLADEVRDSDPVVRWGESRFVVMLGRATRSQAERVAERARQKLADTGFDAGGKELRVSASFGVAQRTESEARDDLIRRAEVALELAKGRGGNRTELA